MTTTQITVKPNSSAASALRPLVFDLGVPLRSGSRNRIEAVQSARANGWL